MNEKPIDNPRTSQQVLTQQLYKKDPLLVLLRDKLHINLGAGILIVALLFFVSAAGIPAFFNKPLVEQELLRVFVQATFGIPVTIALYWLVPDYLAWLFATLETKDLVGESRQPGEKSYNHFLADLIAAVNDWRWIAVALAWVAYYWVFRLFGQLPREPALIFEEEWARFLVRLLFLLIYTPIFYGAVLGIIKLSVGLIFTWRFFDRFKIKVNPLDPDGAGGYGILGQMLVSSVLISTGSGGIAAVVIILSLPMGNLTKYPEALIFCAIYLFVTPMLFISWLWLPHRAMVEARDEILSRLAGEFRQTMHGSFPSQTNTTEAIRAKTDRLEEIKRQYKLISETFPIWPLRIDALRTIVGTSLLPLISSLISGLIPTIQATVLNFLGRNQP